MYIYCVHGIVTVCVYSYMYIIIAIMIATDGYFIANGLVS